MRWGADADPWLLSVLDHAIQKLLVHIIWAHALQFCFPKEGAVLTLFSLRSLAELAMPPNYFDLGPNAVYHL